MSSGLFGERSGSGALCFYSLGLLGELSGSRALCLQTYFVSLVGRVHYV